MKNSDEEKKQKVPLKEIANEKISPEVLKTIPQEAAAVYKFVPLAKDDDSLEVGMVNPEDLQAKEALRFIAQRSGLEISRYTISERDFKNILKQYENLHHEVKKALEELQEELGKEEKEKSSKKTKLKKFSSIEKRAEEISSQAPISKIVAVILKHATEGKASDIHIEPLEDQVKVRFRVDGILHLGLNLPKRTHSAIVSRVKILSELKIDESRVPQDGRFQTKIGGKKIDFRVSTFPISNGEKVVLRVLDPNVGLNKFEDLGLHGYNLRTLKEAIKQPFGTILVSGPTGSGKTTTLYAVLKQLNQEGVNIVSLEDPVEYYIEGVNQSQTKPEIQYTFASGLRHILRQDPDVIMVGEIRDEETAELAVHAALTGHILLSTIHTNDAIGVVPRLVDMGVGSFLIPPSLNLAVAQRLTRRLCDKCKKEITAPEKAAVIIEKELNKLNPEERKRYPQQERPFKIYRPAGCKYCGDKGTTGRIAVFEMLKMNQHLENIINKDLTESSLKEEAERQGMITMKQDGIYKVLKGQVAFEEMLRVVENN